MKVILGIVLAYITNTQKIIALKQRKHYIHNKDKPKRKILLMKDMIIN